MKNPCYQESSYRERGNPPVGGPLALADALLGVVLEAGHLDQVVADVGRVEPVLAGLVT